MVADERDGWVERTVKEQEWVMELESRERCELVRESWKGVEGKTFAPLGIEALEGKSMV